MIVEETLQLFYSRGHDSVLFRALRAWDICLVADVRFVWGCLRVDGLGSELCRGR